MEDKIKADFLEVTNLSISGGVATFTCATHKEEFSIKTNVLDSCEAACPKCNEILNTANHNERIQKISRALERNFDYSLFQDVGIHNDSVIVCPNHGIQKISLKRHLTNHNGQGCPLCSLEFTNKTQRSSTEINNNWMTQAVQIYKTCGQNNHTRATNKILSA